MSAPITYHAYLIAILYGCAEMALTIYRRAGHKAEDADQRSLGMIWVVISAAIVAGLLLGRHLDFADMTIFHRHHEIGIAIFFIGLALRAWSVIHLGRFFTVNVAIADDHHIVDNGPYRFVRHPSYTGVLLAYLGLGLCLANWVSLLVIMIPSTAIMLWRIAIEEKALHKALGADYARYSQRTHRLLPFIY